MPTFTPEDIKKFGMVGKIDCSKITQWPHYVKMDDEKRFHSEDGPSIHYLDDMKDYHWHGVQIDGKYMEDKSLLTPQIALAEPNAEVRRAYCEMLGWSAIIDELGGKTIDDDGDPLHGKLVEVEIPNVGACRYLYVKCGTGRNFALEVPDDTPTVKHAQALIADIPYEEFEYPEIRT